MLHGLEGMTAPLTPMMRDRGDRRNHRSTCDGRSRMLFDSARHEPLADAVWDEAAARAAIEAIVARTEAAFDAEELWPAHPQDLEDGPLPRVTSLYLGAAGVIWALHELERLGAAELRRAVGRRRRRPGGCVPRAPRLPRSRRRAGALALERRGGDPARRAPARAHGSAGARTARGDRGNADNPTRELMWGSPGTMLVAQVMHERTGQATWLDAWNASADILWEAWRDDLWPQDLYGSRMHIFGPAHGFAGNVLVLARGGALDQARRRELERRAVSVLSRHAIRGDGLAQWPPSLEPSSQEGRTQWCHGAPGIVASFATLAPGDEELDELLLAGGELTWRAGPLREGREPLPRHGGQRLRVPEALRAHGGRALARARACVRHARARAGGAGPRGTRSRSSHALDRRPRDGALPGELPVGDGRDPHDRSLLSSGRADLGRRDLLDVAAQERRERARARRAQVQAVISRTTSGRSSRRSSRRRRAAATACAAVLIATFVQW